jgi:8-oxo-dGTP pyrophosphatase MutT (NUDIX family)
MKELIESLRARLSEPLPGRLAQRRFAPELSFGRHTGPAAHDTRLAAVMALFYLDGDHWKLPLILRPDDSPSHAAQISFPGGAKESSETPEQTALRELNEEIGVLSEQVTIVGRLSPIYVFNSNFMVTPIVGVHHGPVSFCPCPNEVAEIVELPLGHLLDSRNYGEHMIRRREVSFTAPHIRFERHVVWGATSMMLGELIEVLNSLDYVDAILERLSS